MADLEALGVSKAGVSYGGENASGKARAFRDKALVGMPHRQALVFEGRVFTCNAGSVTTPLTFLVTADLRPDFVLRVPSGSVVQILGVETILEAAAGTVTEIDYRTTQNDVGNGTSSAATVGPQNLRSDAPRSSLCTARQLYTGDSSDETNPMTVHRRCFPLAQSSGLVPYEDHWYPEFGPVLKGAASFEIFVAATTTQATGFLVVHFAEWTTDEVL